MTTEDRSGHRAPIILASSAMALFYALPVSALATGILDRFWIDLLARDHGPMSFRFFLQPTVAILTAWHDGKKDAETGRSPYFWTVLTNPQKRASRLREGVISTGKILIVGLVIDLVYQAIMFDTVYSMEAVVTAILLAFVPYMLLRGPAERWATWRRGRKNKVQ